MKVQLGNEERAYEIHGNAELITRVIGIQSDKSSDVEYVALMEAARALAAVLPPGSVTMTHHGDGFTELDPSVPTLLIHLGPPPRT